jgi:hypothetical protein
MAQGQKTADFLRLRFQLQNAVGLPRKIRNQELREWNDGIEGKTVRELTCSQPETGLGVISEKIIHLMQKFIPVGGEREEWIVEVSLEDAVRAIHGTVADGVDHIIPAADVIGCPGAGLQALSIETGDEQNLLALPEGIGEAEELLDEGPPVLNPFNGDMRKGLENGLGNPVLFSLFLEINLLNLKRHKIPDETAPYVFSVSMSRNASFSERAEREAM